MKTTNHPVLNLIINEDGTKMWYNGKIQDIKTYKSNRDNYPFKRVAFGNRTHSVAKLVCEAWNGMREEMNQVVHRKDKNPLNDHYTNLYWAKRGNVFTGRTARACTSKIKKNEIPEVINRLGAGETLKNIARTYNTSDMSIQRIKKRFMLDRLKMLRERIFKAKTTHDKQTAYAHYMGFKTLAEAIQTHGRRQFQKKIDDIATKI